MEGSRNDDDVTDDNTNDVDDDADAQKNKTNAMKFVQNDPKTI